MKNGLGTTLVKLPGPVLITGHTGFKGAWLTYLLEHLGIPVVGYSLKPAKNSLFERTSSMGRVPETFADIRDSKSLTRFINLHKPSSVIHLAAQPLVLESYVNPRETFDVNVMGTVNLLDISLKTDFIQGVVVVTTDKVYRNNNQGKKFIETDPLGGKDPYSASKVAVENVASAWQHVSSLHGGPKILTVRAGNVIGGGDFAENRLIPDLVRSILIEKKDVTLRNPESTRPWQHVLDSLVGYILALESSLLGNPESTFNFAPDGRNLSVKEVAESFIKLSGENLNLKLLNTKTNKEALTLNLNATKAKLILNWECNWTQREAINQSFSWWANVLNQKMLPIEACMLEINALIQNLKSQDWSK